jgi:polyhydroxyalkanoate synthesis regulator protein
MGEQKENIRIKQVSADKFLVVRTIQEEMDSKELSKVFNDIKKGVEETKLQLNDIPVQVKVRSEFLSKQMETLENRIAAFEPFAEKIKETEQPKASDGVG